MSIFEAERQATNITEAHILWLWPSPYRQRLKNSLKDKASIFASEYGRESCRHRHVSKRNSGDSQPITPISQCFHRSSRST